MDRSTDFRGSTEPLYSAWPHYKALIVVTTDTSAGTLLRNLGQSFVALFESIC